MDNIKKNMEKLRQELNELLAKDDSYSQGRTLEVSQELDKLISDYINHYYQESKER